MTGCLGKKSAIFCDLDISPSLQKVYSFRTIYIIYIPWKSKDYFFNVFSVKTIVLVRVYYQQILENVILRSLTSRVYNIYNIEIVGGGFKHVLCFPQKLGK